MKLGKITGVFWYFPSFWEGLSLRLGVGVFFVEEVGDFPSFWEGLSLRRVIATRFTGENVDFPSFWEGLSLRHRP